MPKFKPYNKDQTSMVVINNQDQFRPGTFKYTIHHIIENKTDFSIFFPDNYNERNH